MLQLTRSLTNLFSGFNNKRKPSKIKEYRRRSVVRPHFEPLEDRKLMAVVAVGNASAVESAENIVFPVSLSAAAQDVVQVSYFTAAYTATDSGQAPDFTPDFTPVANTVTFPAGSTLQNITVPLQADARVEAHESFHVKLHDPVGATIDTGKALALGTITDDDGILVIGPESDGTYTSDHTVHVYRTTNGHPEKFAFQPYGLAWFGGIRVATGDFNGDNIPDIVTGAGPGGSSHVRVFRGRADELAPTVPDDVLWEFDAYPGFGGGVFVAVGDVTGDSVPDLVTAAGDGGGPHVKVFNGDTKQEAFGFMAFTTNFTGGVRLAVGDFNGDGKGDIAAAQGPATTAGVESRVTVFSGQNRAVLADFVPYPGFTGGLYAAAGDLNADGRADLIVSPGAGGTPAVKAYEATAPHRQTTRSSLVRPLR